MSAIVRAHFEFVTSKEIGLFFEDEKEFEQIESLQKSMGNENSGIKDELLMTIIGKSAALNEFP